MDLKERKAGFLLALSEKFAIVIGKHQGEIFWHWFSAVRISGTGRWNPPTAGSEWRSKVSPQQDVNRGDVYVASSEGNPRAYRAAGWRFAQNNGATSYSRE